MSITGGIPLIGFISPTEEGDRYPVTLPKYGLGGLRSVETQVDLYSIPFERREVGMIVFVSEENKYWYLLGGIENQNWSIINLYGETGTQGFQGETGPTGERGIQGFQGYQGLRGLPGLPGLPGQSIQGEIGFQGLQGPLGPNGTGEENEQGVILLQGQDWNVDPPEPQIPPTGQIFNSGDYWLNYSENRLFIFDVDFDGGTTDGGIPGGTEYNFSEWNEVDIEPKTIFWGERTNTFYVSVGATQESTTNGGGQTEGPTSCVVDINPRILTINQGGGQGSFSVITNTSECSWSATSGVEWVTLNNSSGVGNGTVSFDVEQNDGDYAIRTGLIQVNNFSFVVNQTTDNSCYISRVDPSRISVFGELLGEISVETEYSTPFDSISFRIESIPNQNTFVEGLTLYASSNSNMSGVADAEVLGVIGNVDVSYDTSIHTNIKVVPPLQLGPAGDESQFPDGLTSFFVTHDIFYVSGGTGFENGETSQVFLVDKNSVSFFQSSTSDCSWSATSDSSWIRMIKSSGTGNDYIEFFVDGNTAGIERYRYGNIFIGGTSVSIIQETDATSFVGEGSFIFIPITKEVPEPLFLYGASFPNKTTEYLGLFGDMGSQSISLSLTGNGITSDVVFSSPASSKYFHGPSSPNENTTPINFGDRWFNTTNESEYAWYPKIPTHDYLNLVYTEGQTSNGYWTNQNYSGIEEKLDPNYGRDLSAAATASGLGFTTVSESYSGLTTTYADAYHPNAVSGDYFLAGYESFFGEIGGETTTYRILLQKQQDNTWREITTEDVGYVNQVYSSTNNQKYYYGFGTVDVGEEVDRINWYDISSIDLYLNSKNISVLLKGNPYLIPQNKYLDFLGSSYDPIGDQVPSFGGNWVEFAGGMGEGSKYFYGSDTPTIADGATQGSKWFNTNLGLEFTFIVENDGFSQWVVVNAVGIDGEDGVTGPTGPPVNFTFGLTFPENPNFGDYFLGASGSGYIEGNLYIFARLDTDPSVTGSWWEISGVRGDDGDDGATGATGPPGAGAKYFYGPTTPDSSSDGLTLGSKWFNTNVGAEFTYIIENDNSVQWIMTNVFSVTGPQGPLGGGTGNQGFQGRQGFQGNIGSIGVQGFQGFQGNTGSDGAQGFQGIQGFQGNTGPTGDQGFQGFQGNIGPTGLQGFQGVTGPTGLQGFQGFQGPIGIGNNGSGYTGASIRNNFLYITKIEPNGATSEINLGYIGPTGSSFIFDSDLTADFQGGKYFGRYVRGDSIPAQGRTAVDVIKMALVEGIPPIVSLSSSTTNVPFYSSNTSITIPLSFSYQIISTGATVASATLSWKYSNQGSWTTLTTNTSLTGYNHTFTIPAFNIPDIQYKYEVTDSAGGSATSAILTVSQDDYINPSVSLVVNGSSLTSPETNFKRERGNVSSNLSATITRSSPFINLSNATFQRSVDLGSSWTNVGNTISSLDGGATISIPSFNDNPSPSSTIQNIIYRVRVEDSYRNSGNPFFSSNSQTINLLYFIFYGPTASIPANSSQARSLPSRIFTDGSNPFELETGTVYSNFIVCLPKDLTIVTVFDLDNFELNITPSYVENLADLSINDFGSNIKIYNRYSYSPAGPYLNSATHSVTRTGSVS